MADIDPNTLSREEYAKWKRKHVMEGVRQVTFLADRC